MDPEGALASLEELDREGIPVNQFSESDLEEGGEDASGEESYRSHSEIDEGDECCTVGDEEARCNDDSSESDAHLDRSRGPCLRSCRDANGWRAGRGCTDGSGRGAGGRGLLGRVAGQGSLREQVCRPGSVQARGRDGNMFAVVVLCVDRDGAVEAMNPLFLCGLTKTQLLKLDLSSSQTGKLELISWKILLV